MVIRRNAVRRRHDDNPDIIAEQIRVLRGAWDVHRVFAPECVRLGIPRRPRPDYLLRPDVVAYREERRVYFVQLGLLEQGGD